MQLRHMHFCIIILSKRQEKETAEHITVNKILEFEKGLDQKWSWHTKNTNSLQEKEGLENAFKSSSICPAVQVGEGFRNCGGSEQG